MNQVCAALLEKISSGSKAEVVVLIAELTKDARISWSASRIMPEWGDIPLGTIYLSDIGGDSAAADGRLYLKLEDRGSAVHWAGSQKVALRITLNDRVVFEDHYHYQWDELIVSQNLEIGNDALPKLVDQIRHT